MRRGSFHGRTGAQPFCAMKTDHERSKNPATVDLREALGFFRDHSGKIIICVLLAVGLTFLYLRRARPVYVSSALLEVAPSNRQDPNAMEDLEASDTLKTIELKVASPSVLLGVIRRQHLADDRDFAPRRTVGNPADSTLTAQLSTDAYRALSHFGAYGLIDSLGLKPPATSGPYSDTELLQRLTAKIDVNLVRGSRLIEVRANDHSPEKARRLAQAVIDEFFQQAWDARHQESVSTRERLVGEAKQVGNDFKASQEKLEAYRDKYNSVSLEEQQNIVVARLRNLDEQVATAKNLRLSVAPEAEQVRLLIHTNPEQLLTIGNIADLQEVIDLRREIGMQEAAVATLAKRYGPLHPTMIQARSQLEDLHVSLQNTIRGAGERVLETYASAQTREKALEDALAEQEKAALELDRIAIPYHSLEHEVQANATMYQKILDQLKEADVTPELMSASDVDGTDIRVLGQPLTPMQPASPRQKLLLALSTAAGLILGCGSALVSRGFDNTISSVDEAESFLGLPVFVSIPRSSHSRLNARPLVLRDSGSIQAEAFRSLRTALSLTSGDNGRRCVLLTSAVPAEGKSFCALNLAAAFAQQDFRTLLIDGDLRRPGMLRMFTDPNGRPTLNDCLKNPALFPAAVQATSLPNLSCLGNWISVSGGAELLGRDAIRGILQQALASFDRVVIDTAPLMAVSDTLHIAKEVETICLVVQAGKTPRRLIRRSLMLINDVAKRPAAGVVLNKISRRHSGSRYYAYYNYDSAPAGV